MTRPVLLWYWGHRGGGAHFTLKLAQSLIAARGREGLWVAVSEENEELAAFRNLGVGLIVAPVGWTRGIGIRERVRRLLDHARFVRRLPSVTFEAIVITMNFPLAWPLIYRLRKRTRRFVYVAHDAWPHPGDYWRQWQIGSQRRLIAAVDDVVALSVGVAGELRRRFPSLKDPQRPRLHVIPIESVFGPVSPAVQETGGPVRFLFLGRLLAYKGLALLFEAVQHLGARRDWQLTIAGDGPLEGFVAATFGGHPQCNVEAGWLSRSRFEKLLKDHDVLVCPYLEGSQSGVIPEGLALGKPAIATPVGGLPGQIGYGRYGWVARTVTAEALAAEMKSVIDYPEKRQVVSSAILNRQPDGSGPQRWLDLLGGTAENEASIQEAT